ncbi:unnamed protein product [Arabidopsis lyrata]|nr:unnamed protein product [Arabidopsis lyrata]
MGRMYSPVSSACYLLRAQVRCFCVCGGFSFNAATTACLQEVPPQFSIYCNGGGRRCETSPCGRFWVMSCGHNESGSMV